MRGHVPDPGERALGEQVEALLARLPCPARLVARQMQPDLARPGSAGENTWATSPRSESGEVAFLAIWADSDTAACSTATRY